MSASLFRRIFRPRKKGHAQVNTIVAQALAGEMKRIHLEQTDADRELRNLREIAHRSNLVALRAHEQWITTERAFNGLRGEMNQLLCEIEQCVATSDHSDAALLALWRAARESKARIRQLLREAGEEITDEEDDG